MSGFGGGRSINIGCSGVGVEWDLRDPEPLEMVAEGGGGVKEAAEEQEPAGPGGPPGGNEDDEGELSEFGERDASAGPKISKKSRWTGCVSTMGAELTNVGVGGEGVEDRANGKDDHGEAVAADELERGVDQSGEFRVAGDERHRGMVANGRGFGQDASRRYCNDMATLARGYFCGAGVMALSMDSHASMVRGPRDSAADGAGGVDEDADGEVAAAVGGHGFAVVVEEDGVGDVVFIGITFDVGSEVAFGGVGGIVAVGVGDFVEADAEHDQIGAVLLEFHEVGDFTDAGGAPGGPEVDKDGLALEIAEMDGFAVKILKGEIGGGDGG